MNSLKIQHLNNELDKLEEISDIIGTAIVNRNGLLIVSKLPRDIEDRKFCAMAATMFGAIETAASTLGSNSVTNLTVEFNDFQLIIMAADEQTILVSLLNLNANLGLILIEIEEIIKNLKNTLKE
ncbi:MAG: roadblock/LC7 domain-containing protein [Candidatus Lokiarchaeota archaeon]|nr:roadblock/LC7 domain-containing protein [Candidatus Lokiarchaeota archaeon]